MNEPDQQGRCDDTLEPRPPRQAVRSSVWKKLKRGLFMTHTELLERLQAAVEGRGVIDDETFEYLEECLLGADLGVASTLALTERLRERVGREEGEALGRLREILVEEMASLLRDVRADELQEAGPTITLVVGVNGTGKTTSAAKLAWRSQQDGRTVLLAAADTFRAAAIEQLVHWGERLGVGVIRQKSGADPAAVVYDALQAARARHIEHLIVDTAGRLHTKGSLMEELAKIGRVVSGQAPDWRQRTILVLDATTGQNSLAQAREFGEAVSIDGLLLAKLDGTAKGGMVVALARELHLPVLYLGVGEGVEDLVDFRPHEFAEALLG